MTARRPDAKGESRSSSSEPQELGIGPRLRAARESKGWTREALAYHASISWAAIAQIESGRRTDVRRKTLDSLSSALEVSVDHLLGHERVAPALGHRALIYRTPEEFLGATTPFLQQGLARGDGLVAVTTKDKIKALRNELGSAAGKVRFISSGSWYRDPYTTLEAFRTCIDELIAAGHGWVRAIGEPVWLGRSRNDVRRWVRYEALINLALANSRATIVCPYDAATLPDSVVTGACRTHPAIEGERRRSAKYRDPAELLLLSGEGPS